MQNASSAGRKLTNEERVEVVKRQKKRNSFQLAMLSVIGILGFLLLWQAAVLAGVLPSRYVPAPTEVIALFATKLVDPNPDGAVLGVHIMASLQVALTGFLLAIVIGIPLGLFMGWFRAHTAGFLDSADHHLDGNRPAGQGIYCILFSLCTLCYQCIYRH
jgi:NitT/TauT family transport system permease protein